MLLPLRGCLKKTDTKLSNLKNQKKYNPKQLILVDADGVLLNWEYAFAIWMEQHGHEKQPGAEFVYDIGDRYGISREQGSKLIKLFNESAAIGFLPPLRDAMYYVKRLHEEHGYVFHCITSLSNDVNAQRLREMNLNKLFGETAFERVTCLETGADKNYALEEYAGSGCWWVEDKPENAEVGHELGLKSILMEHGHNMSHANKQIPVVKNWREIYAIITS
jgi:FMN phosphatase YigB (HAD superfamily)